MKKFGFIILLAAVTFSLAFAGDVIKVLSIYTNGIRTTIPMAGIDSLDHSLLDADSIQHSEYTSSIIHAIDQDYQIPISKIDSIVIGEIDVEQYNSQINEIQNYIDEQTDLEVDAFQTNLLNWLNANENIQEATINENKDFISVKFKNGLDFSICFQDISIFEGAEESVEAKALRKASEDEEGEAYDVSYQEGEEIIESPKILYIQGLDFILSNAQDEINKIHNVCDLSPMKINIKQIDKNLTFVNEDFSDYGMVLITQTHGFGYSKGSFSVKRDLSPNASVNPSYFSLQALEESTKALVVYTKYKDDILKKQIVPNDPFFNNPISSLSTPVYLIRPSLIEKKLYGNHQAILYGSFCWSERLSASVKNNTVVGFKNPAHYFYCWKALTKFIEEMTLGNTVDDALNLVEKEDYFKWGYNPQLTLRRGYDKSSKQRYFSISINDITEFDKDGYPIVTGQINGFKNLKNKYNTKDSENIITPILFVFSPDGEIEDMYMDEITVEENGKVTCKDIIYISNGLHYFMLGFAYGNDFYAGSVKPANIKAVNIEEDLCPDDNHPHAIDLGLPSGTKWSCCNVGASKPEEYGGYYAWGETCEKNIFSEENYVYYNNTGNPLTSFNTNIGDDIAGTTYDVANNIMGAPWRMPSKEQIEELMKYGTVLWRSEDGYILLMGWATNNKILLPSAGYRLNDGLYDIGDGGYFWTSTFSGYSTIWPYTKDFATYYHFGIYSRSWAWNKKDRHYGFSVRAVCP